MTKQEFSKMLSDNHKSGRWICGYFDVEGVQVGVKVYGKWIQRMEVSNKPYYSSSECRTVAAFKAAIEDAIEYTFRGL